MGEDVGGGVGVAGGAGPGDLPEVAPGPAAEVGEGQRADFGSRNGRGRIDPGGEGAEDLGVVAGLGLLEDPLQGPPGAVAERDPGDDLQQARAGERAVVFPEGQDDLVEPEPVGQRDLGIGGFEGLDLFDPVVALLASGVPA